MSHPNMPGKQTNRAVAALNSLLNYVSAIKIKEIGLDWPAARSDFKESDIDILANVEVFGHSHTLACQICIGEGIDQVRAILEDLRRKTASLPGKVTPVLILPALTAEVRELCERSKTGCLDLRGNGRLALGEVFISTRSLPRNASSRSASSHSTGRSSAFQAGELTPIQGLLGGFPPVPAGLPHRTSRTARHARSS